MHYCFEQKILLRTSQCVNLAIFLPLWYQLREINFHHFEAPKPAILTILAALNL